MSATRPICSIIVLACLLISVSAAPAVCPWGGYKEWQPAGGDCSWSNPANWPCYPIPPYECLPGPCDYVAIMPSQPGPCITGSAQCFAIALNLWDPTSWGGQDTVVTITETASNVNFGEAIQINSQADYDSATGGRAIVNIYGGTVTTPNTGSSGITIGGGSSTYGDSYGILNMYGGLVSVPRIAIYYGDANLYGGTLECTTDPNFVLYQYRPKNRINVNGGTLKLKGNHTAELNTYIINGRIVCIRGGELAAPVYDGTWTILTGTNNFNVAWGPSPANNATNVHYKQSDGNSITLSWQPGDLAKQHDVYFGTSTGSLVYQGSRYDANSDPHNWTITGSFNMGYNYYWRIDETNDSNMLAQGLVWKFTTHDGKAYNPKPADDANTTRALSEPLQLCWTAGDWASYHRVFFSTNYSAVGAATTSSSDGRYRGTVTDPVYPLSRLAEKGPNPPGASWTLQAGKAYYWRIDEVNGTTVYGGPSGGGGVVPSPSKTWSFIPGAYINIDDFEDYNSTDDVNTNWLYGYTITSTNVGGSGNCNSPGAKGYAGRALIQDSTGRYLQYTYNNSGANPLFGGMAFSETKRSYSGGTSFTGGGVIYPALTALRIDYKGLATNAADSISPYGCPLPDGDGDLDRMYVAIEDSAGNVAVYLNPDPYAQRVTNWTSWYTALKDINDINHAKDSHGNPTTVNLNAVTGFAIGFGIRGDMLDTDGIDVNSIVMFDNIRLYPLTCFPQYGPTADLDGDCDVDMNDLSIFADHWLEGDNRCWPEVTQPKAPILWYKFEETGTTALAQDSGTGDANNYVGTISNWVPLNWKVGGGRDGNNCIYLPSGQNSSVSIDVASLNFMGDANHSGPDGGGITFATWINADLTAFGGWVYGFIVVKDANGSDATTIACPHHYSPYGYDWGPWAGWNKNAPNNGFSLGPSTSPANYGGRWNHWAFVKAPHTLSWYCNGILLKQEADTDSNNGDPNIYGPLFPLPVSAFTIGLGGYGGNWAGYIDDFQVYDYALSAAEVAYLANDGDPCPLYSGLKSDLNHDGIVDFKDFAILGQEWRVQILWP